MSWVSHYPSPYQSPILWFPGPLGYTILILNPIAICRRVLSLITNTLSIGAHLLLTHSDPTLE